MARTLKKPSKDETERDWHSGNGEILDSATEKSLQLTHRAVAKFPELSKRYQKFIGTAAVVSSALIVLASIAVARRLHRGESPEHILRHITAEEIESVAKEKREKPKRAAVIGRFRH